MRAGTLQLRLLAAVVAVHLVFFASAIICRPKVASDASSGMLVWRSMEQGAGWNRAIEPDPENIARDHQEFLTWWSPGQYLVVGPLHRIGMSWGIAIATATLCCSLAGIAGFWRLYLLLGFGEATSAWAAAILSVTWHVTAFYGEFPGGELPLFAAMPWLIAAILKLRPLRWWSAVPFAVLYLAGAMVKLSFCVTAVAAVAGICLSEFLAAPRPSRLVSLAAKAGLMIFAGHLLLWAVFLRFGVNPSTLGGHGLAWWYVVPSVAVMPAGSVIGLGSLLARVFLFPLHPLVSAPESLAPLLWVLAAGTCLLYRALDRKTALSADYKRFAMGMAAAYMVAISGLTIAGASISLEERHFMPVGAVILPALVELARCATSRAWRLAAGAGLGFAAAYGVFALAVHHRQIRRTANVGVAGFTQHIISRDALRTLHGLDNALAGSGTGAIIYVPSPEISFEIRNARVLSTFDLNDSAQLLRGRVRHGRVPLLVMLSNPVLESGGRDEIVRRSFADYAPTAWSRKTVGEWSFYYQGTWPAGADQGNR
jgi:hypothetical protein